MIDSKLITLLMVNELHSFTQAAKKLSLTQPAVSQHVRQLEKELGVTILPGEKEISSLPGRERLSSSMPKGLTACIRTWSRA